MSAWRAKWTGILEHQWESFCFFEVTHQIWKLDMILNMKGKIERCRGRLQTRHLLRQSILAAQLSCSYPTKDRLQSRRNQRSGMETQGRKPKEEEPIMSGAKTTVCYKIIFLTCGIIGMKLFYFWCIKYLTLKINYNKNKQQGQIIDKMPPKN